MSKNTVTALVVFLALALVGLLVTLYFMLSHGGRPANKPLPRYSELMRTSESRPVKEVVQPSRYTRKIVSKLKLNMELREVRSILGQQGEEMNFASAPPEIDMYKWETRFPADIVVTFKEGKVVGISSPGELTPGMITPGVDSKAAPKLVYNSDMVKSAFAKWNVAAGRIVIVAFDRQIDGSDEEVLAKVFHKSPKQREKGALFELSLKIRDSTSKPERYRFSLFKQASWPSVYSCDVCSLMNNNDAEAKQQIVNFKGKAVVGSNIDINVVGQSREPMFEDSIHARWDLDLRAKLLLLEGG